jgi:hypothetical protein
MQTKDESIFISSFQGFQHLGQSVLPGFLTPLYRHAFGNSSMHWSSLPGPTIYSDGEPTNVHSQGPKGPEHAFSA